MAAIALKYRLAARLKPMPTPVMSQAAPTQAEQGQALACARLLGLGESLILVARVCAVLAGVLLLLGGPAATPEMSGWHRGAGGFALMAWSGAEWLGGRVRLDQLLFLEFSKGTLLPAHLDIVLGLPTRVISLRTAGALRLLKTLAVIACLGLPLAVALLAFAPL